MCGRFVQSNSLERLVEEFDVDEVILDETLDPSFNLAPSHLAPVIYLEEKRTLRMMQWGFPSSIPGNRPLINARAETIDTKPTFKQEFNHQRCIVPATGFYEWTREGKKTKQPHFIYPEDNRILGFAGLWTQNSNSAESFTIITTEANVVVRPIHDRMPAILSHQHIGPWLNSRTSVSDLKKCLAPAPDTLLLSHAVSPSVNAVRNNRVELMNPYISQSDFFHSLN